MKRGQQLGLRHHRRGEELVQAIDTLRRHLTVAKDNFDDLDSDGQLALIRDFQNQSPGTLDPIVAVVCQCYYRDNRVMASLGMPSRAPFPTGYQVPQGDWSLLDPVRDRSEKVWRDV